MSSPVCFGTKVLKLDVGNHEVDTNSGHRDKYEENPVEGGREHELVHPGHVGGHELDRRPEMGVGDEVDEPDSDAAPDEDLGDVVPAVHQQGRLKAGGDDHHGVDCVAEDEVAVGVAVLPQHPRVQRPLAQPKE